MHWHEDKQIRHGKGLLHNVQADNPCYQKIKQKIKQK